MYLCCICVYVYLYCSTNFLNLSILLRKLFIFRQPIIGLFWCSLLSLFNPPRSKMWLFVFSSLIVLFFVTLSCCSFDKVLFKISGLFTGFFKILKSCIKVSSATEDIQEWWSYGVWDFDISTFWPANFFLFHNFRIPSIRFFANCNITLVFRCRPLPFRCALDKLLLSTISKSKSFVYFLNSNLSSCCVWSHDRFR